MAQSECFPCPAGYTCLGTGTTEPLACGRGVYCIEPTISFTDTLINELADPTDVENV